MRAIQNKKKTGSKINILFDDNKSTGNDKNQKDEYKENDKNLDIKVTDNDEENLQNNINNDIHIGEIENQEQNSSDDIKIETPSPNKSYSEKTINPQSDEEESIDSNRIKGKQKNNINSNTLLNIAKSYLKKHRIVFTEVVYIWNFENNSVRNYIFVLSLFYIIIFKQKRNSNKLTKKVEQSYIDLSSISLLNNEIIKIKFKKSPKEKRPTLFFQTENPKFVINSLNNHIQRFLSSKEIRLINFEKIPMPKSLKICTSHSILYRFNSLISQYKIEIPVDMQNKISQILFTHSNTITLSKIKKIKEFFPLLSSCILMNKFVNQIYIMNS